MISFNRQTLRKPKAAFILAASITLVFIMILIAMIVAYKNRAMQGFTMNAETEALETEGVGYAFAQLRGVLEGNGSPVSFGLASPAATGTFNGLTPASDVAFSGNLTTYPLKTDGSADGYGSNTTTSGIAVPSDHSLVVLSAKIPGDTSRNAQKYLTVYSGNYPYGLMAVGGQIKIQSAHSVGQYDCDPTNSKSGESGLMTRLYASGSIGINNDFNGRACSGGGPGSIVTGGSGGILAFKFASMTIPADFNSQLSTFKGACTTGLSSSLQSGFGDIHSALHHDFGAENTAAGLAELIGPGVLDSPQDPSGGASTSPVATYQSPGSTDYDDSNNLNVGTSLRIPSGDNQELTFATVTVNNDLLLESNSVLHLTGSLTVNGNIRQSQNSTLVVDGTTSAAGLCPTFTSSPNAVEISSTFYGKSSVTFTGAMTESSTSWIPGIPSPNSNPYPSTLSLSWTTTSIPPVTTPDPAWVNPLATAYDVAEGIDIAKYASDGMQNYLGTVIATGSSSTSVPGVLVLSDSTLTMGSGDKAAGLFIAPGITLNAKMMVGAIWSSGDINAPTTDYRYFPYYTHAYAHTASGSSSIAAIEQHPTAYGKVP